MELRLKGGARVTTTDGQEVGRIDRVVLAPQTNEVTHVVVRQGLLLSEDKVAPVHQIHAAAEDEVVLRLTSDQLGDLRSFEETHYVPLEDEDWAGPPAAGGPIGAASLYWYPPLAGGPPHPYPYDVAGSTAYIEETERNVPENAVALRRGAKVVAADGVQVGGIAEVLTDGATARVTDFVIEQGFLFKERKRVPVGWIRAVAEDVVELAVGSKLLDRLRPYEPAGAREDLAGP
jgi:uncharacterized protein YrrD